MATVDTPPELPNLAKSQVRASTVGILRSLMNLAESRVFHHLILAAGAILSFLPLISEYRISLPESSENLEDLFDANLHWSSVATIALLIPLVVDVISDVSQLSGWKDILYCDNEDAALRKTGSFITFREMMLIATGFVLPPIIDYVNVSHMSGSSGKDYMGDENADMRMLTLDWCAHSCRFILIIGVLLSTFSRIQRDSWPRGIITLLLLCFLVAQVVEIYAFGVDEGAIVGVSTKVTIVRWTVLSIAFAAFFVMCLSCGFFHFVMPVYARFVKVFSDEPLSRGAQTSQTMDFLAVPELAAANNRKRFMNAAASAVSSRNGRSEKGDHVTVASTSVSALTGSSSSGLDHRFNQLYLALMVFCIAVILIVNISTRGYGSYNIVTYSIESAAYNLILIGLLVLNVRKAKTAVSRAAVMLQSTKHTIFRYMSHELLTPLNSAVLGLKLVSDDLDFIADVEDVYVHETIADTHRSLMVAVELLEFLSHQDKLECGTMELRTSDVRTIPLLTDCVELIRAEAQRIDVALLFSTTVKDVKETTISRVPLKSRSRESMPNPNPNPNSNAAAAAALTGFNLEEDDLIHVDRLRIAQVLRILLQHALKQSPHASGSGKYHRQGGNRTRDNRNSSTNAGSTSNKNADGNARSARHSNSIINAGGVVSVMASFVPDPSANLPLAKLLGADAGGTTVEVKPSQLRRLSITGLPTPKETVTIARKTFRSFFPFAKKSTKKLVDQSSLHPGASPLIRPASPAAPAERPRLSENSSEKGDIPGKLVIKIVDNGKGMTEEEQSKLFDTEFNPEVLRTEAGTGSPTLRLLIAKGIIDLHGGNISVFSHGINMGTTFTLEIPMTRKLRFDVSGQVLNLNRQMHGNMTIRRSRSNEPSAPTVSGGGILVQDTLLPSGRRSAERQPPAARSVRVTPKRSPRDSFSRRRSGHFHQPVQQQQQPPQPQPQQIIDKIMSPLRRSLEVTRPRSKEGEETGLPPLLRRSMECKQPTASLAARSVSALNNRDSVSPSHTPAVQELADLSTPVSGGEGDAELTEEDDVVETDRLQCLQDKEMMKTLIRKNLSFSSVQTGAENQLNPSPMHVAKRNSVVRRCRSTCLVSNLNGFLDGNNPALRGASVPSLHILVVDDSPMVRKMMWRTLLAAGHSCDQASDGLVAVQRVKDNVTSAGSSNGNGNGTATGNSLSASPKKGPQEKLYDAILMDFTMPNMDGPTATKEIRKLGYKGAIFGVTGNTMQSDVDKFVSNGVDKVLTKPFNLNEFHGLMQSKMAPVSSQAVTGGVDKLDEKVVNQDIDKQRRHSAAALDAVHALAVAVAESMKGHDPFHGTGAGAGTDTDTGTGNTNVNAADKGRGNGAVGGAVPGQGQGQGPVQFIDFTDSVKQGAGK